MVLKYEKDAFPYFTVRVYKQVCFLFCCYTLYDYAYLMSFNNKDTGHKCNKDCFR